MIIEAAKGGHTQVVKLLLEYPNRVLMNSPESALVPSETNIPEVFLSAHRYIFEFSSLNMYVDGLFPVIVSGSCAGLGKHCPT